VDFDIWEGVWGRKKVALKNIRGVNVSLEEKGKVRPSSMSHLKTFVLHHMQKFLLQVQIWRDVWLLDKGRYILPIYGACFTYGPYPCALRWICVIVPGIFDHLLCRYLVSPWMKNGEVMQYLERCPTANRLDIVCVFSFVTGVLIFKPGFH